MASFAANDEKNMAHKLPNEVETAATLLKFMAGVPAASKKPIITSIKLTIENAEKDSSLVTCQPPKSGQASETKQYPFQVQLSPPSVLARPQQVPDPLHHKALLVNSPNNNQQASGFVAPPYIAAATPSPNYLISAPSTYAFLQSIISQQHQVSLKSSNTTMTNNNGTGTPNPLLLLQHHHQNPQMPLVGTGGQQEQQQQEVEKALNSKPQRGRKRRNLNEEERQELTRTRNREHAKSTRERKKQRYTELLDMERCYQDMRIQQELQGQRRQAVCRFLKARQAMLQQTLNENTSSSFSQSTNTAATTTTSVIDGLIVSRSDFRYHIRGQRGGAEIDGVTLMGLFDRSFAALLPAQGAEASYRYDDESIALTERGDAVVDCSICFGSRAFKTLHMNVSFAGEMSKILSVDIAFLQEEPERPPSLSNQVSHPSVVSLDDRFVFSRSKTEDEANPPTME